jgi:hypothetical protein
MSAAITQQIPKDEWQFYFEALAKQYQGWSVTVEVLAGRLGDQRAVDGLPLQGISFEVGGSQKGDILVEAGDQGTAFETHLIHRPLLVRASDTQIGVEADLEVETEEGVTHLILIRRRLELPPG